MLLYDKCVIIVKINYLNINEKYSYIFKLCWQYN